MNINRSKSALLKEITAECLDTIDTKNPPTPEEIASQILDATKVVFELENSAKEKPDKWRKPTDLSFVQIGDIILRLHPVVNLSFYEDETDECVLAMYQDTGIDRGIYVTNEHVFHKLIREYNYTINSKEIAEVMSFLQDNAPRKTRCCDPDLIAVNNGIFNYATKQLMDFTPDLIFTSKSHVNYNPQAQNVVIHNNDDNTDWDVESWMADLSDDPEIVNVLWEVMGAIIRPNVRWNKSAWFYSETGNNGKGTLCELMRNLCGKGSYTSISIEEFSQEFKLTKLISTSAIIVDENDVGGFVDRAANLKAVITNDVIHINRKYKEPVSCIFKGFMVQCLNALPKFKDKSESFYRRQLIIPFTKCFTGQERRYIKNDYLHRPEVLEYVLRKVLNMNYYELSEPSACHDALQEYKSFNDPIRQFVDEVLPECQWDLLPFPFLYDLYKAWFKKNIPSGVPVGKSVFISDLINLLPTIPDWYCKGRRNDVKPAHRMDKPEPLIWEYDLKDWMNPVYKGPDINQICTPMLKENYTGLLRK